ncbi:hypothetical protein AYO49_05275 [Verrucomicrobiaceae bacterium SCGC AG-212-N21]|nr:hypothetical protein AYO49_05275 [Verrucomicrobiaceae bacterium SCGC AG-212-N21]
MTPLRLFAFLWVLPSLTAQVKEAPTDHTQMVDIHCPQYGGRVRQIFNPEGDEHDLYHYRSVFNANNSRIIGIETPKKSRDYIVTLYDGDGNRLKRLFTQNEYDWRLAWDRHAPKLIYTWSGNAVYRYDVESETAEKLKQFTGPTLGSPSGLSLNQAGDRLLVRCSDSTVRTYRLPAMDDERIAVIESPAGWGANWDKLRYTGYRDTFALTFEQKSPRSPSLPAEAPFTRIYDGLTGAFVSTLRGITVGHHDFSPDGKLAYVETPFNQAGGMKLHVVNLDGTGDKIVFQAPREKLRFVRNYHITWPSGVRDWFLLSFFPQSRMLPPRYDPWLDEMVQVFVDGGRYKVLARTGTTCGAYFWAQPQQSCSADGTRVLFHTNGTCTVGRMGLKDSGTIDQCILYLGK